MRLDRGSTCLEFVLARIRITTSRYANLLAWPSKAYQLAKQRATDTREPNGSLFTILIVINVSYVN
jgi:hypothetical protein